MKPHPSPRCVSSLSQQTSRAPSVTANDNGARAFSSDNSQRHPGVRAGCEAPALEKPRANSGLKPVGASFAAVLGKLVVE